MSKRPAAPPFTPHPEQLERLPGVSGSEINGVGERDTRRPTPIYWHDAERIAHGDLQQWFYDHGRTPEVVPIRAASMALLGAPPHPVAPRRAARTPAEWSARIKAAALEHEADLVGIARLDPEWVFTGYEADYAWIVVLGVAMDHDALATAPGKRSQIEVQTQYARGARAAVGLANWMRGEGLDAKPHGGSRAGPVLLVPPALQAGFGELGKHGSIINRGLGSMLRLACVMTNAPLVADAPDTFGADDFCASCRVCERACPVDAIAPAKRTVRGAEKWYVDFDRCVLYFNEHNGCGICIADCPWSRPGTAPRLAARMAARQTRRGPSDEGSRQPR